jgi:hypothetical protein
MSRVKHLFIIGSMLELSACSNKDPCDENPNLIICLGAESETDGTGETDNQPHGNFCAPLDPDVVGYSYECQGTGNGWLELSIYPVGPRPPECLNWGVDPKPAKPTIDDCVPMNLTSLTNGIPSPGACCTDEAKPADIVQQCNDDCGHAACKLAIEKLRDAALSLSTKGAEGIVRLDLFYLANLLEMPPIFDECVTRVTDAAGELTPVELGPGSSGSAVIGHVESATLNLQCALDDLEPYTFVGNACDAPPNIPIVEEESNMGGIAETGAVTVFGPGGDASASLHDISFGFTETLNRSGTVEFLLDDFTARSSTVAYGSLVFTEPSMHLVAPASGTMIGEQVTFPPGSVRMEVTAEITADGEPLFDGRPMSAEYLNSDSATATRSEDGKFAFVEATFEAGTYRFVLNTAEGSFQPR